MNINNLLDFLNGINEDNTEIRNVIQMDSDIDPVNFVERIKSLGKFRIIHSSDGEFSTVQDKDNDLDHSKSSRHFELHTDGAYYKEIPDLVILYCENEGRGDSPTIITDTHKAFNKLEVSDREILHSIKFHYLSKKGEEHDRPFIERHPRDNKFLISNISTGYFSFYDNKINRKKLPEFREVIKAIGNFYDALDSEVVLKHYWRKNDLLIFDNNRFLHGRVPECGQDKERKLYRIWLDFNSKY